MPQIPCFRDTPLCSDPPLRKSWICPWGNTTTIQLRLNEFGVLAHKIKRMKSFYKKSKDLYKNFATRYSYANLVTMEDSSKDQQALEMEQLARVTSSK